MARVLSVVALRACRHARTGRAPDAARRGQEGEWCEAIDTDVPRTPLVLLAGIERGTLASVLRAVAFRRPDVGYCQGMDYVAAIVLRALREGGDSAEDAPPRAFAMLACLLARDGMLRGLYTPGFPEVRRRSYALSTLLAATRPELSAHLEKIGACVEVAAFAPWLQTAFGYHAGEAWPYELVAEPGTCSWSSGTGRCSRASRYML